MKEQILKKLKEEFSSIGEEKISGNHVVKIIDDIVNKFTIPKEVEEAQKFLKKCHEDIGFMGSPEYSRQKKIFDSYFDSIQQKQKEEEEKAQYLRLKLKYDIK